MIILINILLLQLLLINFILQFGCINYIIAMFNLFGNRPCWRYCCCSSVIVVVINVVGGSGGGNSSASSMRWLRAGDGGRYDAVGDAIGGAIGGAIVGAIGGAIGDAIGDAIGGAIGDGNGVGNDGGICGVVTSFGAGRRLLRFFMHRAHKQHWHTQQHRKKTVISNAVIAINPNIILKST